MNKRYAIIDNIRDGRFELMQWTKVSETSDSGILFATFPYATESLTQEAGQHNTKSMAESLALSVKTTCELILKNN